MKRRELFEDFGVVAQVKRALRPTACTATVLVSVLFLCAACAHGVEGPPPPQPDAGTDAGDPCGDCWAWCGKEDNQPDVIFCTNYCARICS